MNETNEIFWLVWSPNGGAPRFRHTNEASAKAEAERLALANPGTTFIVLQSIGEVYANDPLDRTSDAVLLMATNADTLPTDSLASTVDREAIAALVAEADVAARMLGECSRQPGVDSNIADVLYRRADSLNRAIRRVTGART